MQRWWARRRLLFAALLSVAVAGGRSAPQLFAQDYQVFGDIEGVTTYHHLENADPEHVIAGGARIRADHRLSFERAELVADTELELTSESGRSEGAPAAMSGDGGGREEIEYFIDEAYLSLFPLSPISVSAGKQRVNWGTGYTFSPSDTLHPRSTGDRDEGFRGMSVTFTPTADLSIAGHVSADEAFDDPETAPHTGLRHAVSGSAFLGNVELVLSGVYGPESTARPAVGASADLWGLVVAAEAAVEFLNPVAYPDDGDETADDTAGFETKDKGTPQPLALAAVEYNTAGPVLEFTSISEYLFAGTGYTRGEARDFYSAISAARGETDDPSAVERAGALAELDQSKYPVYLGRHYINQTLILGIAGYVEIESGVTMNAADLSYEAEQTIRLTALDGVDFFAGARWYGGTGFAGTEETEFGVFPGGGEPPGRLQVELGSTVHF
ncbi:MAG: hypothetical protein ACQETQ_13075 [Spirochaetota bacterium]